MNREEQNMDKAFREKLEGFSPQPPMHVWDNIQRQLQAQKRKRRIVLFSRIAAAAVVLLAFLAGWYFSEKSEKITPAFTETQIEEQQQNNSEQDLEKENTVSKPAEIEKENIQKEAEKNKQNNSIERTTSENRNKFLADASQQSAANSILSPQNSNSVSDENYKEESVPKKDSNFKSLDRANAVFKTKTEDKLHKKQENISVSEITEIDRMLIAENISNLKNEKKDEKKWKVGMNLSPGYSSQSTSYSEEYSSSMTSSSQNGNVNVTGGLSVQMKAGKKLSIESGVYYNKNGKHSSNWFESNSDLEAADVGGSSYFNTVVDLSNSEMTMNSGAGVIEFSTIPSGTSLAGSLDNLVYSSSSSLLSDGDFASVFEFVEIPLYFRYLVYDSKFDVELVGGVNADILTGNNVYWENGSSSENVGKIKNVSTLNMAGAVGFSLNYDLSKRISLAFEPRFSYYLNSIIQDSDVDYRPYRFGVYTGLYYEF